MKQIVTLLGASLVCLLAKSAQAQFSQNFDTAGSFTGNCWSFDGFFMTTDPSQVITGTGSLYTNPPVNNNGSGTRDVVTPYLNFSSTTVSISFHYKLTSALNGNAVRQIEAGLLDRNGVYTSLDIIRMDKQSADLTQTHTYANTFTLATPTVQKLVLKFSGSQGDGNTRMIIDDLAVSTNAQYGPSSTCNSAPVAANNTYIAPDNTAAYTGASVLNNDSDPNGESLTAALATPSADGTVVMHADGTFTFTPYTRFKGTFTTFTYTINDNGYTPLSTTATVYIYYSQVTTLPLKLIRFSGVSGTQTNLSWSVAGNETGLFFEVQRSSNGNAYQSIATFFTTEKTGEETYQFADAVSNQTSYYRLKVVNKDGTTAFSNVLLFKTETAAADKIILLQNPVQATLHFAVPATTASIQAIRIYTTAGAIVYAKKTVVQKSNNSISLSLQSNLPAGMYILEVATSSGSKTATFLKQ